MALGCESRVSGQVDLPGTRRTLHLVHSVSHPKAEKSQAQRFGAPWAPARNVFLELPRAQREQKGVLMGSNVGADDGRAGGFGRRRDDGIGGGGALDFRDFNIPAD